jgi:tRNA (guanine-N7-)-methyltransferase
LGKDKLARWNELETFKNVIQTEVGKAEIKDHTIKGNWNQELFKNENPIVLELGCGKGEYTVGLATKFPEKNFIGVDIKGARMWRGAKTSHEQKLSNTAFLRTRIEFINYFFARDEVDEIWITFPDPHPGLRNANKRLTSPYFLDRYRAFLKVNGLIHLKTDNSELHRYTHSLAARNNLEVISATEDLYSNSDSIENVPSDILSIRTHYEKMFLAKGLKINYLCFRPGSGKILENDNIR